MFILIFLLIKISANKNAYHATFLKNENLNFHFFAILSGLPTLFQRSDKAWEKKGEMKGLMETGENTSMTQFRFLYCQLWTDSTPCSGISIVFEKKKNTTYDCSSVFFDLKS